MATSTLTTLANALKTYFLGPIIIQLDNGSGPVYATLEKTSKYIVGNAFKFPLEYGRSGGLGFSTENGDLPTPSARKYAQGEAESKNCYARFAITDKALKTCKNDKASFANQITRMMDNLVIDGNDMLRRNLVGSTTGSMGTVASSVSNATVTVTGPIEAFYPGQLIDVMSTPAFSAKAVDGKEISDVDYDNNTITFGESVTVVEDDIITLAGNYGLEMTGLKDIFLTDTIYGISRTTNKWFQPVVYDNYVESVAQDIDSLDMQKAIDVIEKRTGEKPNFIVCNDGVKRGYIDEQNTYKSNLDYKKVAGGYTLVSYDNVPITPEKYMDSEIMDFINTKNFNLGRLGDWDWLDEAGSIMHQITNKPAYDGALVQYAELLCFKPAANARIRGIKEY